MSQFDDFMDKILKGAKALARKSLKDYKKDVTSDTEAFLAQTKDDLQRWTKLLAKGELSQDDFEYLVLGRKEVAELHALKQAGLTLVRLERFRNALADLVIDTAFEVFL